MVFLKRELNMAKLFLIVVILVLLLVLLVKPFEAELSNHCRITQSGFMIEACRIGIAHRAAGPSGAGERENEQQDGNQRPSIEPIPATFARCCQLIVTNRWLRPPRDQANCSSRSEGLPECNERGWATDVTRCAHPVLEG